MEQYRPNEKVSILIARRGRLQRLDATFGVEPASKYKLEIDPAATDARRRTGKRGSANKLTIAGAGSDRARPGGG